MPDIDEALFPQEAIIKFDDMEDWKLVVVGDIKTPEDYALKNGIYITPQEQEEYDKQRTQYANGMGGLPIVGDPDYVANTLLDLEKSGLRGIGISMVNYLDELPFLAQEVLPRLEKAGIRVKPC